MTSDLINISLGFLEGVALIASPCILPILPIILGASIVGNSKRPIGIVLGFVITFAVFTFFIRQLTLLINFDTTIIRQTAYAILFLLALIMISPYLSERFNSMTARLNSVGQQSTEGGFWSGLGLGMLIALVWTPCAGPILAAVIIQVAIQKSSLISFLTLLAFSLGAAIPMLLIAIYGRKFIDYFSFVKTHTQQLRQLLGVIILMSLTYMIFYADKITDIEPKRSQQTEATQLQKELLFPYQAPEIVSISHWINSKPQLISELKGKVVLLDFWTYSCINCIRTLPYIKRWHQDYADKGLVIIGVHTPEFLFEANLANVKAAVEKFKIKYPVALDNQYATWRNYDNHYWPAHYLIDQNSKVVYTHFGEGDYDVTENNIRYLLQVKNAKAIPSETPKVILSQTPETYLGYSRAKNFASKEEMRPDVPSIYTAPPSLAVNQWALSGSWQVFSDHVLSTENNASVTLHFQAKNVFMVMGTRTGQPIKIQIQLNNNTVDTMQIDQHSLYQSVNLPKASPGVVKITTPANLEIYTFTFGS